MTYSEISDRRKEYNISQTKLAMYGGFSKSLVSAWELGKQIPNEYQLERLNEVMEEMQQKVVAGDTELTKKKIQHRGMKKKKLPTVIMNKQDYQKRSQNMKYNSEYAVLLRELYFDALKEKDYSAPKGIALFSGCGGMTLGFEAAGFDIAGHVEINDCVNKIYSDNFHKSKLLGRDICQIKSDDILGWKREFGSIDIIIGGPPCQGFSLAGKREAKDERNRLYQQYVRIVSQIHPKVFVFENVALMTTMKDLDGELFINKIIKSFRDEGYGIHKKILDAQEYGVPQSRERVILVGVADSMKKDFVFPGGMYGDVVDEQKLIFSDIVRKKRRSFRYATEDLEDLESGERSSYDPLHWAITHPQHIIDWLKDVPEGHSAHENRDPEKRPPSGFNTTYKRITWDDPCSTISTNFSMISGCRNVHPYNTRSLTIREAARAQSFPDEFVFSGKWGEVRKAIGNAVPPILARVIADEIKKQLL